MTPYHALYNLVGASEEDHFVFTSSGAEAVNHVVWAAYLDITRKNGKNHFLTGPFEEAPTLLALQRLEDLGCALHVASGYSVEQIAQEISPRTALVSVSAACGMTGRIHNLDGIANLCRERGILLHVEASHILGKSYFSWESDVVTFEGKDILGPAGTGGLFLRGDLEMGPLILGGDEQAGLRGGEFSHELLNNLSTHLPNPEQYMTEVAYLRGVFEEELCTKLGANVFFQQEVRVPHISLIEFPFVHMESLHLLLAKRGVTAHMGGGRYQRLPLLLRAYGNESHSCLSFRFSSTTTKQEIEKMVSVICDSVHHLRRYSEALI